MKEIFNKIKDNPLFNGIDSDGFEAMFKCMEARVRNFKKDRVIMMTGDSADFVGLILSGNVKIIKESDDGNDLILSELSEGNIFGETLACAGIEYSPVTVRAAEKSDILLINYKKIIKTCSRACVFHTGLIENMLKLIAKKNLILNRKIEILSKRSIREKLLAFFDAYGSEGKFTVPFNREEMARYICADRSAMSNELCKMRDEGLIKFKKNEFELL